MVSEAKPIEYSELEIGYHGVPLAGPFTGTLKSGRVHLLSGPNGSGKTTLLRTLLGLLPAVRGGVRNGDQSASYVPQIGTLDPGFPVSCREVVATGLPMGTRRSQRGMLAAQALEVMKLGSYLHRPFAQLSGGQRQRVLIARALCADAQIIALDEPTAGVDAESSALVWQAVRKLADQGRTVLAVTHDLFRAPEFSDVVLVLDQGRLEERAPRSLNPKGSTP